MYLKGYRFWLHPKRLIWGFMCGFSGYQALAYNEVQTCVCSLNRSELLFSQNKNEPRFDWLPCIGYHKVRIQPGFQSLGRKKIFTNNCTLLEVDLFSDDDDGNEQDEDYVPGAGKKTKKRWYQDSRLLYPVCGMHVPDAISERVSTEELIALSLLKSIFLFKC